MPVDTPGSGSAAIRCFHTPGKETFFIYEDCESAYRNGELDRPQNGQFLPESMVLYRHWFYPSEDQSNSKVEAMVLAFECTQKAFFKKSEREEIKAFFVDLMQRVEYEFALLTVVADLRSRNFTDEGNDRPRPLKRNRRKP